jgi:4-carboxymuconolactone decarboxylase
VKTKDSRYERGLKKIKKIYGDVWDIEFLDDISPELGQYTVDFLYGDIYNVEKLDARAREIAIIASLITLGSDPIHLKNHIHGALNVGCSKQEVIQIIVQMAVYAGFPAAVDAMGAARDVFKDRDQRGHVHAE